MMEHSKTQTSFESCDKIYNFGERNKLIMFASYLGVKLCTLLSISRALGHYNFKRFVVFIFVSVSGVGLTVQAWHMYLGCVALDHLVLIT